MDFLSGLAKGGGDSKKTPGEEKSSNSDVFSNAKVLAEAAQAQFGNEPEKCDKAKAAGAGANLLDAAEHYAKLDETKGAGKYAEQAENYLRQYSASSTPTPPHPASAAGEKAAIAATEVPSDVAGKKAEEEFVEKPAEGGVEKEKEKGESEGGYGGMLKAAGGFFK